MLETNNSCRPHVLGQHSEDPRGFVLHIGPVFSATATVGNEWVNAQLVSNGMPIWCLLAMMRM